MESLDHRGRDARTFAENVQRHGANLRGGRDGDESRVSHEPRDKHTLSFSPAAAGWSAWRAWIISAVTLVLLQRRSSGVLPRCAVDETAVISRLLRGPRQAHLTLLAGRRRMERPESLD